MPDLEQQLTELATAIEWPPTPALRVSVPLPARRGGLGWGLSALDRRWALAAAAVLLIMATLLAYTPSREAIASWINVHTSFIREPNPPTPSPLRSGPPGETLNLGSPITLDGAQGQVSWKITVPSALGPPDQVYLKLPPSGPTGGAVTLVYASRSDIPTSGQTGVSVLVTEARGQVNEEFFQKTLGSGTQIEEVSVNGHPGYWISGRPHNFYFFDANGEAYFDTLRLATNTLLFDNGGTLVRIEGDMSKDKAIQIGGSV